MDVPDCPCRFCACSRFLLFGQRNAFGNDYEKISMKAGDKYTAQLGELDSDKDGFSNDQEFGAGTNPGDPNSKP